MSGIKRGLTLSVVTTLAVWAVVPLLASSASAAAPGTLSLVATSGDGAVFDLDEYVDGDLTVQVTDSVAGSVDVDDSQDLLYHWEITSFDATSPVVRVPATGEDVQVDDVVGQFEVPLPAAQASGSYVLVAGLGPDTSAANAIPAVSVLTVRAGNATVELGDADPLLTPAGADRTVKGSLRLEDGTGLPDRLVDLDLVRGTEGSDPEADAGFLPALPDTTPLTSTQATTTADGSFEVVVSDPAEEGQGTELGGIVQADTATTPDVGDADAGSSLEIDLVSETPPTGSTLVVDDLGDATPGQALAGQMTVTAPDDTFDIDAAPGMQGDADSDPDPVEGQVYSLTLDHGFFTTGDEVLPSVVGAPAGTLEQLGQTLTGVTDAAGHVAFQVAIGRDVAFDDDGLVAATVTATAGDLSAGTTADWDSAHPLNGGSVQVRLAPPSEQVAPVNPAVAGNRTYYDIFTLDQFGNRVTGEAVDLTYSGDTDDFDYSDDFLVTDLDRFGDIWVVSFEPGDIDVTGTWSAAPTYRYTDTSGTAATGTDVVTGATTASFYEVDFDASTFSIRSTPTDVVEVGRSVTQTVKVVDQLGNPVRGNRVQFFRFGPDASDGEPRVSRLTNSEGKATYTFVGTAIGRARITAEVSDGTRSRTLTNVVVFGAPVTARLSGASGPGPDQVTVKAQRKAAGARVTLYRVVKDKRHAVATRKLDASGAAPFKVRDGNGAKATVYVALVRSTATTVADTTNTIRVR